MVWFEFWRTVLDEWERTSEQKEKRKCGLWFFWQNLSDVIYGRTNLTFPPPTPILTLFFFPSLSNSLSSSSPLTLSIFLPPHLSTPLSSTVPPPFTLLLSIGQSGHEAGLAELSGWKVGGGWGRRMQCNGLIARPIFLVADKLSLSIALTISTKEKTFKLTAESYKVCQL